MSILRIALRFTLPLAGIGLAAAQLAAVKPVQPVFVFAFANEAGDKLCTPGLELDGRDPRLFDAALGDGGTLLAIAYVGPQDPAEADPNHIAPRIDRTKGHLYRVTGGKAVDNKTYVLVRKADHPVAALGRCTAGGNVPETDRGMLVKLQGDFGRKIAGAWRLAGGADGSRVHLVRYGRKGDQALAAIAWTRAGKTSFHAMPAKYDAGSTWRVDDGGELNPAGFTVLFLLRSPFLAVAWDGAEGQAIFVFAARDGKLVEVAKGSRYWGAL